ncbi:MAG: 3-deoxy-manno-octulosonate cytidylyltransferase [Arhodomonas sp.]|nr:3-deoxy-manno-octulosonate cytidylyltransferase [Arhodomonas sp.]
MEPFIVVIPARYAASRLPGKPLVDIGGRPMIAHVIDRARESRAERVIVATDDRRITTACRNLGAEVMETDTRHESGTDRLAEVSRRCGLDDDTIVVNLQGDEPLMPPELLDAAAGTLAADAGADLATLSTPLQPAEAERPDVVKVVCDRFGRAMYFSRARIP